MPEPIYRALDDFPYPIAYPYSLVFDGRERPPSIRRWALCFTEYQLLRTVCLPLVGQYLREDIDASAQKSVSALNRAIAAIRSPFFSDWIALAGALSRHLPRVGIEPLFPRLGEALKALGRTAERPVGLRGRNSLNPLEAILALRNETAHGGLADEQEAAGHLELYLPVLHEVLAAFDFLAEADLLVVLDGTETLATGRARLRRLRGAILHEPGEEEVLPDELIDALEESRAVLRVPGRPAVPLYPLFNPLTEQEPLYLYDGHYGIRVETKQRLEERSYIYYLGTHHRAADSPACERLKELLAARHISFFLSKEHTYPWTIADSAADYSRRTLDDLIGQKYFPPCYVPFEDLDRHFERFLRVPDPERWAADVSRARHVNGLVLVGLAGSGKTAFLARQVERLTAVDEADARRENPNLVLFLRGDGVALRAEGMSLFRDVAEKLGLAATPAETRDQPKPSATAGFSLFAELLDHLHGRWKEDRVEGRRLILVLDALNEAPYAGKVVDEALEMIATAARFPWCKVVISTRQEWLAIWSGKMGAQETSRLEGLRPWLYVAEVQDVAEVQGGPRQPGLPVLTLEPFTSEQAAEVYRRYQATAGQPAAEGRGPIPGCRTVWDALPEATRALLTNPLHLHLFMETFDGREAEALTTVHALFRRYVERTMADHPGLDESIEAVVAHLLGDLARASANLSDDDCNAIRRAWAEARSAEEARLSLSPVEAMAHESLIVKRVREEGGGYRFLFEAVAEYLIYRYLNAARPTGEDELAYWTRRAQPPEVFPEYAGAFGFLLRDWVIRGRLEWIPGLVEVSPSWMNTIRSIPGLGAWTPLLSGWMGEVLTAFLVEQGRGNYVPGTGSAAASATASALARTGGAVSAYALDAAGLQLASTSFAVAARMFYQACVAILEAPWGENPENVDIGDRLARALNNLGNLLGVVGQAAEAEPACRRAVEIYEALWEANRENVDIGEDLAGSLNNLGLLLGEAGQVAEAEPAHRRALEIREELWEANPGDVDISDDLAASLNNLGNLLRDIGQVAEAERAYRRALEMGEALWEANPENVGLGDGLARTLNNLGLLLGEAGQVAEAEPAHRRAVEIREALWEANPENVDIGNGLALAVNNLGSLLADTGRATEAEQAYRRAVEIREALWEANPEKVGLGNGLAGSLNNLGNLLRDAGQAAEAEEAYRRALGIREALWWANPQNVEITAGYAGSLCAVGRFYEAEPLIDRLLGEVPQHPYARQLKAHIASIGGAGNDGGQ